MENSEYMIKRSQGQLLELREVSKEFMLCDFDVNMDILDKKNKNHDCLHFLAERDPHAVTVMDGALSNRCPSRSARALGRLALLRGNY